MSRNGALVQYKEPSSGTQHRHNFVNRYLADDDLRKPSQDVAQAVYNATKQEVNRIVGSKTDTAYNSTTPNMKPGEAQFIKYTPKQQGDGHNSEATQRIIKMHEVQVDPLEPAKFKHKRIPKGPGSPPKTIMHSPPRKLTVKDQQDWKIPPCISNWKNAKGYTIPLEMRLSADGRTLQQHTINEKFAKLANSFYIVERQARKEIEERNKIQKTMAYKDYLKQEEKMREAASLARAEKNKILERTGEEAEEGKRRPAPDLTEEEEEAKKERDMFRYINKREQERERRIEVARSKKSKTARDEERDVSEKIALGQAQPTMSKESMYDQRLFNQTSGLESGFGDEDEYNAFDKPLFQDKTAASIYNIKEFNDDIDEPEAGAEGGKKNDIEKMLTRAPNRGFEGAGDKKSARNKPVEFEKHDDETFNLDNFINDGRRK
jgi:SNW domain-containing protein 1